MAQFNVCTYGYAISFFVSVYILCTYKLTAVEQGVNLIFTKKKNA